MKVSLNWVRQFTDIDISNDELIEKIGVQLGAVEGVESLGEKYKGIVVARVAACEKHPNADKLNVCLVDDGGVTKDIERNEAGLVQVVCGAPNVRAGLLVAWLPPGATVPATFDKDPFVLGARELRGIVSNGMLASASELAISDDHDGIVEVDIEAVPGTPFSKVYNLDDVVIDIENKMFTHRPDCFGILGVAREIAGIQHKAFTSPEWYLQSLNRLKPGKTKLDLQVTNSLTELVPRFMAVAMADVTIKASPLTLQTYLSRVGIRPINNIVDITNYLMVLTGQPTHAYDADKLTKYGALSLETRLSKAGDTLRLLNGKEIELKDDSTILITSNDIPVGIGGAMGGADTEVDENTKNIVIECANFDMYSVRRTSMKYGIFTDAVTRFNKGQSLLQNDRILEEAVQMVQSLAAGHVASDVKDFGRDLNMPLAVQVKSEFINERLGSSLSSEEIAELLKNVEFEIDVHHNGLSVRPPFWRTDIEIAEDIVEEVGRLYGYDQLPLGLPERDLTPVANNQELDAKRKVRSLLAAEGANEVLTYGFVHGDLLKKVGQSPDQAFKLSNALSPDLQYYRLSITPSLLEKVHPNIKAGFPELALFELGKTHTKTEIEEDGLPKEFGRLAFVVAMDDKLAKTQAHGAPYYLAKKYLESVYGRDLKYLSFASSEYASHQMFSQLAAVYEPARSAVVMKGGKLVGMIGEYTNGVKKSLKLPEYCAGFEAFISTLVKQDTTVSYIPLAKYPKTEQDITLRVPVATAFDEIYQLVINTATVTNGTVGVEPLSIFQREGDDHKQVSLRVTLGSYQKTLTTEEVNKLLESVSQAAAEELKATRV